MTAARFQEVHDLPGGLLHDLVERRSRKSADDLMGRTDCNRIVNFPGGPQAARLVGQLIEVRITEAYPHSLRGEVVTADSVAAAGTAAG